MQGPCSWLREQVVQGFVLLQQVGEKRRLNAAPQTQPKVLKFGRNSPFCQQTCRRCIHGLNPFLDASSERARQQPYGGKCYTFFGTGSTWDWAVYSQGTRKAGGSPLQNVLQTPLAPNLSNAQRARFSFIKREFSMDKISGENVTSMLSGCSETSKLARL